MPDNVRKGCKDMWNAYMVEGATWSEHDIPLCPTTAEAPPKNLISFSRAKTLWNKALTQGASDYHIDAFLHFYIDDQKFVGKRKSIWDDPEEALMIAKACDGMITPDFSTYADFPDPIKRNATYMMRAFGFYAGKQGVHVINNVRWGTAESWEYCFDGIPRHSTVSIGTVASNIRKLDNRPLFEGGFDKMIEALDPATIVVYGSANNPHVDRLKRLGVKILSFPSETNSAYKKVAHHE